MFGVALEDDGPSPRPPRGAAVRDPWRGNARFVAATNANSSRHRRAAMSNEELAHELNERLGAERYD
jgi:hypothetical protein